LIVRKLEQAEQSSRRVDSEGWSSVRLLLNDDAMGFSFHITTIFAGAELEMHYRHHLESVYCVSGKGSVEDLAGGDRFEIEAGTLYALDQHDRHVLRADSDMVMACVFNPPLTGREIHDENGVYPLPVEAAS
jgi:L-ectoine synthase